MSSRNRSAPSRPNAAKTPVLRVVILGLSALSAPALGCERDAKVGGDAPSASSTATLAALSSASSNNAPLASASASARTAEPSSKTYNVLLIMVDSLRFDMPWAGYPRQIAPRLTALEKRCTSYTRAYSLSSYTAKSVAPALVGKYGSEMPRDGKFFTKWLPSNLFIGERAQAQGHRTLAGHGHGYFMEALGNAQGFDDYRLLPGTFLDVTGVHDVTSEKLTALAQTMLSDPKNTELAVGKRFFAYFHYLDPHYTYYKHEGHPDFGAGRRDLYDNEVHFTDHWLGELFDFVERQSWGKQTALIVTADHGEGFGEHGHFRHAYEIWESLVHVPWFICLPGVEGRRIDVPRGHIDLAPTVADLMGLDVDPPFRGRSLLAEVLGAKPEPRAVVVDLPRADLMDRRRAVISGEYKLLAFGDERSWLLYNVVEDPLEENELSQAEPDTLEKMKQLYARVSADIPNLPIVGGAKLKGAPAGRGW